MEKVLEIKNNNKNGNNYGMKKKKLVELSKKIYAN